jgi:glycosyltransferase involved in cell wall biosynthesis
MNRRKFSIITPSLNRRALLESAIQSVLDQHYPEFEHLIIDGGSTDGTTSLVNKYRHIRMASGADQGMYDALNKGLRLANGDIIGFLNTDDQYEEDIFSLISDQFADEEIQAVAGKAIVFAEAGDGPPRVIATYSPSTSDLMESSTIGSNYFNAWFFRRSVFEEIGEFDAWYRIAGDRDFMLRFTKSNLKFKTIDRLVYRYRQHPDSLTFTDTLYFRDQTVAELIRMVDSYLKNETTTETMRRMLRMKHRTITVEMAIRHLKARDLTKVLYYAFQGTRFDYLWMARFGKTLFQ